MATCYSGIGVTSMNNPDSQDMDADIQNNYQEDTNDLGNVEPYHQTGLKHLTHETEQLRQTIEATDNDPMDPINHLEQKVNQLAITLCTPAEPIGEVLKNIQTCYVLLRRKHL